MRRPPPEIMEHSNATISQSLLQVAAIADAILHSTPAGRKALAGSKLEPGQRRLLERIDGFRSIEQLLAMSGDVIGVHASLGKLMAARLVTCDAAEATAPMVAAKEPVQPAKAVAPAASPVPAKIVAKPATREAIKPAQKAPVKEPREAAVAAKDPPDEVETAKRLLMLEARHLLGDSATRLQPRIEACASIAEIYDLIVKFQQHLSKTGKANPDVFLDRLTSGLQQARKRAAKPAAGGATSPAA